MKYEKLLRLVESEIYSQENLSTPHWFKFRNIGPKSPPPFCTETRVGRRRIQTLTDVEGFEKALAKLNEQERESVEDPNVSDIGKALALLRSFRGLIEDSIRLHGRDATREEIANFFDRVDEADKTYRKLEEDAK